MMTATSDFSSGSNAEAPALQMNGHLRFTTLDGLRGGAAVIVVWFHLGAIGWMPPVPSGFLAVDLFFLLSGFVIAYANDKRFASGQTFASFFIKRIIRLYPLWLFAFCLGAVEIAVQFSRGAVRAYELRSLAPNLFMLPAISVHNAYGSTFPANAPGWSLFVELWVLNLIYGTGWRWLRGAPLVVLIALSAGLLVALQFAGQGLNAGAYLISLPGGVVRGMFSFFLGVVLSRHHQEKPPRLQISPLFMIIILPVLLFLRFPPVWMHFYQFACVALAFPAMVFWGAENGHRRAPVSVALGDASYAVYAIHMPLIFLVRYVAEHRGDHPGPGFGALFIIAVVALAYWIDRYYDRPLRGWLSKNVRFLAPVGGRPLRADG